MRSRHVRTFPVSLPEGWDYMNDISAWPRWYAGLIEILDPEKTAWSTPGDEVRWAYQLLGRRLEGVATLDRKVPYELVALRTGAPRLPDVRWEYGFRPAGSRAFTLTVVLRTPEVTNFFGRSIDRVLVAHLLERDLEASLENLDSVFSTGVFLTRKGKRSDRSRPGPETPIHVPRRVAAIVFTDIVDSTRRARQMGDRRWRALMEVHDRVARNVVERYGGRYIKSTGDGLLAAFDGPGRAIDAATTLQRDLERIDLDTRVGIHVGEIETPDDDIGGMVVHIGSRVMAAAGPGEILVSRTIRDMLVGSEIEFVDRGTYHLRGLDGDWHLYAVRSEALVEP